MRRLLTLTVLASMLAASAAQAQVTNGAAEDRLLIVNGNNGRVIYDDGRDDLFCVTRRHVVGYDDWGHAVTRRSMRCR